jgi:hypothetical protein
MGKKFFTVAVVLAVLWTLSHVFYPPLMIIQFLTIIGSASYGYKNNLKLMGALWQKLTN